MRHSVNVQHNPNFERKDVADTPATIYAIGMWLDVTVTRTHKTPDIAASQRASDRKLADELPGIAFCYIAQHFSTRTLHHNFSVSSWSSFINFTTTSSFFLVTISPPLYVAAPPLSFGIRASNPQRRPHWQWRETQPPSAGRDFTLYLFYMYCITNIQTSGSSTRREDVTIAKLLPSVQLTILASWPFPSCSHSIGAVFRVFFNINCMHPLVLD